MDRSDWTDEQFWISGIERGVKVLRSFVNTALMTRTPKGDQVFENYIKELVLLLQQRYRE